MRPFMMRHSRMVGIPIPNRHGAVRGLQAVADGRDPDSESGSRPRVAGCSGRLGEATLPSHVPPNTSLCHFVPPKPSSAGLLKPSPGGAVFVHFEP